MLLQMSVIVQSAMTGEYTGIPETKQSKGKVIDFEAARQRLSDTRQEQNMRRQLVPPLTRTDREKRQDALRRQGIREALAREEGHTTEGHAAPLELRTVQERVDGKWLSDFLETRYFSPEQPVTDKQWAQLKRIDPVLHDGIKENVRLENRIREIRQQAGGDEKVFDALWQKELQAIHAEADKKKVEEWAKVGIKRLPQEEWDKQIREMPDEVRIESYKEGMRRGVVFLDSPDKKTKKLMKRAYRELQEEQGVRKSRPTAEAVSYLTERGYLDHIEWYRSLPPDEKIHFLQQAMGEITNGMQPDNDAMGENLAEFVSSLVDLLRVLVRPFTKQRK